MTSTAPDCSGAEPTRPHGGQLAEVLEIVHRAEVAGVPDGRAPARGN